MIFILNDFLRYFLDVAIWLAFFVAVFCYFWRKKFSESYRKINKITALSVLSFRVAQAIFLTVGQYYIWVNDNLGKAFLNSPLTDAVPIDNIFKNSFIFQNKFGYFIFYSYGRFWLNVIVVLIYSAVFYFFLKLLQKHKERFFEKGEAELGLISSLLVGWPNFVIFLPLVFVFVVIISVGRRIFLKEFYTTLGLPLLFTAGIVILFGEKIIHILNLGVLKI